MMIIKKNYNESWLIKYFLSITWNKSILLEQKIWESKALAHTALQWVLDLQFNNVDFAFDFKLVVDHVNYDVNDFNEFGFIIFAYRWLFFFFEQAYRWLLQQSL